VTGWKKYVKSKNHHRPTVRRFFAVNDVIAAAAAGFVVQVELLMSCKPLNNKNGRFYMSTSID
jgi:hypothetical protein